MLKTAKRKCKFTDEMQSKYPCFKKGRNEWEAECLVCKPGTYISASYKGAADLKSHLVSSKHSKAVRGDSASTKVTSYFATTGSKKEDQVTAARVHMPFTQLSITIVFLSMDCTSSLLKKTFPDSDLAKKFSCARTKTEAIVTSVLAPYSIKSALSFEENDIAYCAVATDGSSHDGLKLFSVLVQYFDWKKGGIQSRLIQFKNRHNETADTIAGYVKETLEKSGLSEKCVAFTGDNCNTMFGGFRRNELGNNVFAKLRKR